MKKIFKNRVVLIAICLVIVIALALLIIFNRTNENMVTRATKVFGKKYYRINCINTDCKYMVTYKGSKKGKTEIKVINGNGKTISKYDIDYSSDELIMEPVNAAEKYVIVSLKDSKKYTHGYAVLNNSGKEVLREEDYTLYPITDKYIYGKKDDLYTIYDYKGNTLYKDVKYVTFYNEGKIITFVSDKVNTIDENSKRILDDYEIVEEVKDDEKTLYLIVQDGNGVFYYFDVNKYKLVGDSFNSYVILSDNKLIVTRKANSSIKRVLLDTNGKEESEITPKKGIADKVKEGYTVFEDSIVSAKQKGVLATYENRFGSYDLKTGEFNGFFNFKGSEKRVEAYNIYEDLETARLEIGCSSTYCENRTIVVYDPFNNSVVFSYAGDKEITKYREYKNSYKVVMFRDNTYALFDDKSELVLESANNIVVIDDEELISDTTGKSNVLLYSAKEKKLLNDENSLALLDNTSNYDLYRYFDEKYMYLFNKEGKLYKRIPIEESSLSTGDKYILHSKKNKVNVYNLIDNSDITIKLGNNEDTNNYEGVPIVPNKGMIIVSNYKDNTIKIYNYKKKLIKKIKKSEVISADYNEENNTIFLVTKKNKKYNLYIIK